MDVRRLLSPRDCLEAVEAALRSARTGAASAAAPLHLALPLGGVHAKAAMLERGEKRYAAIKLNANLPGNFERCGRPTIQGVLVLFDALQGGVLAVMDSIEITMLRTAAASAVAARLLARDDARILSICGCGEQALAQVAAIAQVRSITHVFTYDVDASKAAVLAERVSESLGIGGEAVADFPAAARRSDIIVTCTTARAPILGEGDVSAGAFISAVGADHPEKNEIAPALMARASVVVDALEQCAAMGDLRHAIAAGALSKADVHAELADILIGTRGGRTDEQQVFVFDSTGTALQDVGCAALAYERACLAPATEFRFA